MEDEVYEESAPEVESSPEISESEPVESCNDVDIQEVPEETVTETETPESTELPEEVDIVEDTDIETETENQEFEESSEEDDIVEETDVETETENQEFEESSEEVDIVEETDVETETENQEFEESSDEVDIVEEDAETRLVAEELAQTDDEHEFAETKRLADQEKRENDASHAESEDEEIVETDETQESISETDAETIETEETEETETTEHTDDTDDTDNTDTIDSTDHTDNIDEETDSEQFEDENTEAGAESQNAEVQNDEVVIGRDPNQVDMDTEEMEPTSEKKQTGEPTDAPGTAERSNPREARKMRFIDKVKVFCAVSAARVSMFLDRKFGQKAADAGFQTTKAYLGNKMSSLGVSFLGRGGRLPPDVKQSTKQSIETAWRAVDLKTSVTHPEEVYRPTPVTFPTEDTEQVERNTRVIDTPESFKLNPDEPLVIQVDASDNSEQTSGAVVADI